MHFNHFCRWQWYFDYRAALAKVKNPKARVTVSQGKKIKPVYDLELIKQKKISMAKGQITKLRNKLAEGDKEKEQIIAEFDLKQAGELFSLEDHPKRRELIARLDSERKKFLEGIERRERHLEKLIAYPAEEIFDKNTGHQREETMYRAFRDELTEEEINKL